MSEPKTLLLVLGPLLLVAFAYSKSKDGRTKIVEQNGIRRVPSDAAQTLIASWADKRVASPRSEALPGPHVVSTLLDPQAVPNAGDPVMPAPQWLDAVLASGNTVLISPTDPKVVVIAPAVTAEILANPSKGGKYAILKP